jgi:dihydrodipicolinate synthase/N-acetylneuraminate lyase
MTSLFRGVGVALVSLFDDDQNLDVPATADLAARLSTSACARSWWPAPPARRWR